MNSLKVLFLGDLVGSAGRTIFKKYIDSIRKEYAIDAVIVNGENSAHGRGITTGIVKFFKDHGVDVITTAKKAGINLDFSGKDQASWLAILLVD